MAHSIVDSGNGASIRLDPPGNPAARRYPVRSHESTTTLPGRRRSKRMRCFAVLVGHERAQAMAAGPSRGGALRQPMTAARTALAGTVSITGVGFESGLVRPSWPPYGGTASSRSHTASGVQLTTRKATSTVWGGVGALLMEI